MENEELTPIITPVDWNAEKDCDHFDWEPEPSYTAALWNWMEFHYSRFLRILDTSIIYFRRHDPRLIVVPVRCLSTLEKLQILCEIADASPLVASYRSRLLSALKTCEFAELQRQRVLNDYRLAGDNGWMYPVVELIDWIGYASSLLRDAMVCENEDYRELEELAPGEDEI